ncbi:12743_t:CDS:2, partial [Cetraspora pellucida]
NQEQLEHELCKFFTDITQYNRKPYKVESIISAYTSLKHFLFEASVIQSVNINDRYQFPILYKVVDGKCIELQDQEYVIKQHYDLPEKSLVFIIGCEKNNQDGLKGQNKYEKFSSHCIHIPPDLSNNEFKPIQNLHNYINLCPLDACNKFYLQLTRNSQTIQDRNWFLKTELVQIRESQVETLESQVETPESQFQTPKPQVYTSESQISAYEESLIQETSQVLNCKKPQVLTEKP